MVYAMASIAFLGFLVWSQMMASSFIFINKWCKYFAICWNSLVLINTLKCKNLINYTWSAGNQLIFNYIINKIYYLINIIYYLINIITLRSSETIRKTSNFNYDIFNKYLFINKNINISDNWLTWFIGFSEGDGALLNYNNNLKFILTQKDSTILYEIKNTLNMGTVTTYQKNKNSFSRLIITNPYDIFLLTLMFNGNLVLNHRINQLDKWINIINIKYKYLLNTSTAYVGCEANNNILSINNKGIKLINKPQIITLNDSWLSGFTDAEGCFNVTIIKNNRYSLGYVIKLRFILDQNDKLALNNIKVLFNKGKVSLRTNSVNHYRYTITSYSGLIDIYNYFNIFTLKTNKNKSFIKWSIIYNMILNKEHLSIKGLNKINIIKTEINLNNSINKKIGKKLIN